MQKTLHISVDVRNLTDSSKLLAVDRFDVTGGKVTALDTSTKGAQCSSVSVALDIPDNRFRNQVGYGASVYASGRIGLEYARVGLAQIGLSKSELDSLDTSHVTIQKTTIPYVFKFNKPQHVRAFAAAFRHQALLRGFNIDIPPKERFFFEYHGFHSSKLGAANGDGKKGVGSVGTPVTLYFVPNPGAMLALIELELDAEFLLSNGWSALDSWRNAYVEDRYATIFDDIVRGSLFLDSKWVPYDVPSEKVLEQMQSMASGLLRHHLTGGELTAFPRFALAGSQRKKVQMANQQHEPILSATGIDIKKPWSKFRAMRPVTLNKSLRYPGDYVHPPAPTKPGILKEVWKQDISLFCKDNWPQLLEVPRREYDAAVQGHAK